MPSDLHTHTTFSDGKLTPEELISAARQAGLSYLAITDHDTVDGVAHLYENGFYPTKGVRVIPGIEFSAHHPTREIHVLGFNVDIYNSELTDKLNDVTEARWTRFSEMVAKLHQAIEQRPRAFSCGAKLLQMADPEKIDDAGDTYSALGWALARGKGAGREHFAKAEKVFACCAACAIYRRSMLEKTGVFDERHFAYLEDIDIGYRAQRFGFENWFIPDAVVYHAGSATSGSRDNAFKVRLAARNSVWLVKKNMPALQAALNLPFLAAGCLIKWIYFSRKGLGKEYAGGIRQGLAGMGRLEGPPAEQYLACWKLQPQLLRGVIEQLLETGKAS